MNFVYTSSPVLPLVKLMYKGIVTIKNSDNVSISDCGFQIYIRLKRLPVVSLTRVW